MASRKIERARELRRDQTPPEGVVWSRLRDRRLDGLKFRRQHPIGGYVADFFCPEARLVVEIDGRRHNRDRDGVRDEALRRAGLHTLRFTASAVAIDIDAVLSTILRVARERMSETQGRS